MLPHVVLPLLALLAAGCGSVELGPDAGTQGPIDAGAPDTTPPCTPALGRSYFLDRVAIMEYSDAPDRNGDGLPDNALWMLALEANKGFVESIASGNSNFLGTFLRWPDPVPPTSVDVGFVFLQATDASYPPDPQECANGNGRFLAPIEAFDTNCEPLYPWDWASLNGTEVQMESRSWMFGNLGSGTVEFVDALGWIKLSADYSELDAEVSAVWTACGLSVAFFPGSIVGTMLDFIANNLNLQPDVDRDGDGGEQVVGDGNGSILHCIDGDGTVINGRNCPCDPRMADGYSVAFQVHGVNATIVGIEGW